MLRYFIEADVGEFNDSLTVWNQFSNYCWRIALTKIDSNKLFDSAVDIIDYYKNLHSDVVTDELKEYNATYDVDRGKIIFENKEQLTEFKLKWLP